MHSFSDDLLTCILKACATFVCKCQYKSITNLTNEDMEKKYQYITMSQTPIRESFNIQYSWNTYHIEDTSRGRRLPLAQ